MTKKGKGRQSGGFGSKSSRATQHLEVQRIQNETLQWTRRETAEFVAWSSRLQEERLANRPRFALSLRRNLDGILNDRRSQQAYLLRERRRRNGFLPSDNATSNNASAAAFAHSKRVAEGLCHPEGWLLRYNPRRVDIEESSAAPKAVEKLQDMSLVVFAHYIREYRDAMGDDDLYGALSMLPPESLTELSVLLSSSSSSSPVTSTTATTRSRNPTAAERARHLQSSLLKEEHQQQPPLYMDDSLAGLLGQHPHVEQLCLRNRKTIGTHNNNNNNTLTSAGPKLLIPRTSLRQQHAREESDTGSNGSSVADCWDDDSDDDGSDADHYPGIYHNESVPRTGCNLKLRRLELLDWNDDDDNDVEEDPENEKENILQILVRWFEKCSGITHLSLAGSFVMHHEVGIALVAGLPRLLPSLEVLDVTRCPWSTDSLLARMMEGYEQNHRERHKNSQSTTVAESVATSFEPPVVYYYKGRFSWQPLLSNNPTTLETIDPWDNE